VPTTNKDPGPSSIHSSEARVLESEIEDLRNRLALLESAVHKEPKFFSSISVKRRSTPQESNKTSEQAEEVSRLFKEWLEDESGYDEETWPKLKAALDEDRFSARSLFDE
jgi:hypothetical protein